MTAIAQLTADLNTLNTALGVVEAQTMHKGLPLRKEEEALYTTLIIDRDLKQAEIEQIQQKKLSIKSFVPHFKKN